MKPLLIGLAIVILTMIPPIEVHARTKNPTKTTTKTTTTTKKPSSWFREKYIQQTYDDYYEYYVNRYKLEDNDIDMCPDFEKSATIFAVTGRQIYRITKTCRLYVTKDPHYVNYTPPESHFTQLINITVMDVVRFVWDFTCYTFEIVMYVLSVILLCCSTIFMGIVLFCH